MACTPLTLFLEKINKKTFTFKNQDLSAQTIIFRAKKVRENTTIPAIEVSLTNITYTSPNTTAVLSVDLTGSVLEEGNYFGEIEITDGLTYSDIAQDLTVELKISIDDV